jgi:hypothetical protein
MKPHLNKSRAQRDGDSTLEEAKSAFLDRSRQRDGSPRTHYFLKALELITLNYYVQKGSLPKAF